MTFTGPGLTYITAIENTFTNVLLRTNNVVGTITVTNSAVVYTIPRFASGLTTNTSGSFVVNQSIGFTSANSLSVTNSYTNEPSLLIINVDDSP